MIWTDITSEDNSQGFMPALIEPLIRNNIADVQSACVFYLNSQTQRNFSHKYIDYSDAKLQASHT